MTFGVNNIEPLEIQSTCDSKLPDPRAPSHTCTVIFYDFMPT